MSMISTTSAGTVADPETHLGMTKWQRAIYRANLLKAVRDGDSDLARRWESTMARDCARVSVIECETELGDMAADAKLFDAEHSVVLDEDGKISCLMIGPCEALLVDAVSGHITSRIDHEC